MNWSTELNQQLKSKLHYHKQTLYEKNLKKEKKIEQNNNGGMYEYQIGDVYL